MREFRSILFMGNADPQCSEARCLYLVSEMFKMFSVLSGVQQPAGIHEKPRPEDERERKADQKELENFVRDVAMAFTGQEILFIEEENE